MGFHRYNTCGIATADYQDNFRLEKLNKHVIIVFYENGRISASDDSDKR